MLNGSIAEPPVPQHDSPPDWDLVNGTFSTNNANSTVNTTQVAAMATWHVLQGFLNTFPRNRTRSSGSVSVSLFAESYGVTKFFDENIQIFVQMKNREATHPDSLAIPDPMS